MRGNGYYEERRRKDDPISRLMSTIRLFFFTSVVFAFALGVLATCYYQSSDAQRIPENTANSRAKRASPSPSAEPPDGSEPNPEEKSPPPNSEDSDGGRVSESSR
jgi:hypothetical protein